MIVVVVVVVVVTAIVVITVKLVVLLVGKVLQRFCADKDLHVWGLAVSDLGLRVPGGLSL